MQEGMINMNDVFDRKTNAHDDNGEGNDIEIERIRPGRVEELHDTLGFGGGGSGSGFGRGGNENLLMRKED